MIIFWKVMNRGCPGGGGDPLNCLMRGFRSRTTDWCPCTTSQAVQDSMIGVESNRTELITEAGLGNSVELRQSPSSQQGGRLMVNSWLFSQHEW